MEVQDDPILSYGHHIIDPYNTDKYYLCVQTEKNHSRNGDVIPHYVQPIVEGFIHNIGELENVQY